MFFSRKISIEFVGLPGAGKTQAITYGKEHGLWNVVVVNRIEKYLFALLYVILHPVLTFRVLREMVRNTEKRKGLLFHKMVRLYIPAVAREQKSLFIGGAIDEGVLQFILGMYDQDPDITKMDSLWRFAGRKEKIIVFVKASNHLRNERMRKRQRTPRSIFGEEYQQRWLTIIEKCAEKIERSILNDPNTIFLNTTNNIYLMDQKRCVSYFALEDYFRPNLSTSSLHNRMIIKD